VDLVVVVVVSTRAHAINVMASSHRRGLETLITLLIQMLEMEVNLRVVSSWRSQLDCRQRRDRVLLRVCYLVGADRHFLAINVHVGYFADQVHLCEDSQVICL